MAESGYEKLGKARRRVIRRDKKTRSISGGLDALAEVLDTTAGVFTFAGGQMKKQDTAWKEYEAGYEALGGDVADIPKRPGFLKQVGQTLMPGGDKGFYEMPEGEVQIDDRMFDREKIQEAGSFLGTDAAAALYSQEGGDAARRRYLERVVPGKLAPGAGSKGSVGFPSPNFVTDGPSYDLNTPQLPSETQVPLDYEEAIGPMPATTLDKIGTRFKNLVGGFKQKLYDKKFEKDIQGSKAMWKERKEEIWGKPEVTVGPLQDPQYTDKQRQPYMEPQMNIWDSQIENNKNRRPYDLRPPEIY